MYDFFNGLEKLKSREKAKLCYMDPDSFIVHIKREDIYLNMKQGSMLQIKNQNDHYPKEKSRKAIRLMKDGSGGKIIAFCIEV